MGASVFPRMGLGEVVPSQSGDELTYILSSVVLLSQGMYLCLKALKLQ